MDFRRKRSISIHHWNVTTKFNCFSSWHKIVILKTQGLDLIRWERPKKPQIRYDVEEFIVRRLRKSLFARWKRFSEKFIAAKKMRRKILSKFICLYVRAWRDVTRYHLKVMTHIVSEWKQYEKSILIDPFRIWSNYISTKIKQRECQLRLVGVFSRSKTRKMMFNIFRCWRHEAIYGRKICYAQ